MRLTATLIFILALSVLAFGQEQESPMPDRWRGLVLDQSTPGESIKLLGKPQKDKLEVLRAYPIDGWVTKRRKEKIFRTLEYKKPAEGVQKAWLAFLDDKLVSILLHIKGDAISPNALSAIYGMPFQPIIGQMSLALYPRDFERNQGKIYPKNYPTVYHLAGVSESSLVTATIGNAPSFMGALGRSAGVPDKPDSFPGKVLLIQLISRTLENRDGSEVLK